MQTALLLQRAVPFYNIKAGLDLNIISVLWAATAIRLYGPPPHIPGLGCTRLMAAPCLALLAGEWVGLLQLVLGSIIRLPCTPSLEVLCKSKAYCC
jgi:hypothetical protein